MSDTITKIITTKLKLEGECQYKAGLLNTNRKLKAKSFELALVDAQNAGCANSAKALENS